MIIVCGALTLTVLALFLGFSYVARRKRASAWLEYFCEDRAYSACESFLCIEQITHDLQAYLSRYKHGSRLHGLFSPFRNVRDAGRVYALLRHIGDAEASVQQFCFMSQGRPIAVYQLEALWKAWLTIHSYAKIEPLLAKREKPAYAAS